MNDLMTKSFLNYVDLKKQAMKDQEIEQPDLEKGELNPADDLSLAQFYLDVETIKYDMENITNLLLNLQDMNTAKKLTNGTKLLRGLRDQINSDMVTVLRIAKTIKLRLESLEKSNKDNRYLGLAYREGTPVDRTRISITNGLRIKLRDIMTNFQTLRLQIKSEHKQGLKHRFFYATGEEPTEEMIENMVSGHGQLVNFEENKERNDGLKKIQKSLIKLNQVFLDMAVLVETQGDDINDIEENVARAGTDISGGTNELDSANQMKKKRVKWAWYVGILVLFILFIALISILVS